MTPGARIQAVIEVLTEILETPRPADAISSAYFRKRRYIGSKDRTAIWTRLYDGILRRYHRLSWWLAHTGNTVTPRTLTLAAIIFDQEQNTDTLKGLFSGEKFAPHPLSQKEKKLAQFLQGKNIDTKDMPLRARMECPEWAFSPLQNALGQEFEKELQAMHDAAPLDLRVNLIKSTRDELLKNLRSDGIEVEEGQWSPLCLRVYGRPNLMIHPLFKDGYFEVQDQGSQMIALLANAKPGMQVADFCAGAGGKTLAMAAMMNNKGRVVAMDVLAGRLRKAKLRFKRAGLHNIETRALRDENDKYVKRSAGVFDLVLTDAPCTGVGTWRRDPDKRWKDIGPTFEDLKALQRRILSSASRLVKKGGHLVYATCSMLPDENEAQIDDFLSHHPDFTLHPAKNILDMNGLGDYLNMTPAKHGTDGFFAAVMTRQAA